MVIKKNVRFLLALMLWLPFHFSAKAQAIEDTTFNREMSRIGEAYWNGGYIQFKIQYQYDEFDSTGNAMDTMTFSYQIFKDKYYIAVDSVEYIQNETYRITIFNQDSLVRIEKPVPVDQNLFGVNLLDAHFRDAYVSGFTMTDSAATRKISIQFKNTAPYLSYSICYDTATYYLRHMSYRIKKGDYLTPSTEMGLMSVPQGYISIKQVFSHFSAGEFTDSVFASSRIFVSQNGVFVTVSPYSNYDLINSILE